MITNSADKAFKVEIDGERWNILDREGLLWCLIYENVTERNNSIFRRYFNLRSDSCTFEVDRNHRMVRKHDDTLFVDLLG